MHFIAYHNTEERGYSISKVKAEAEGGFRWYTNKPAESALGGRVWMIVGEGAPRRFYLAGWFTVEDVAKIGSGNFAWELSGKAGRWLEPPKRLDFEAWFKALKKRAGNFAFGLQKLNDEAILENLKHFSA